MPFDAEPRFTGCCDDAAVEVVVVVEVEVDEGSAAANAALAPASTEGGGMGAPDPLRLLGALPLVKELARAMGDGAPPPADSCFCRVES
jgi:hypothetical protein